MPETTDNLKNAVTEWLAGEGYRLECIVHKAFHDVGLNAVMSNYIETPEGKWREIDVTAFQRIESQPTLVRVLCECKYSQE